MAGVDYQHLGVRGEGQPAHATLNRPDTLNALNTALVSELRDFFGGQNIAIAG